MKLRTLLFSSVLASASLTAAPLKVSPASITNSANQFGIELLLPMGSLESNTVYSPFSVYSCLSMVTTGAKDKTLDVLAKGLHWTSNPESVGEAVSALFDQLLKTSSDPNCNLKLYSANALFAASDIQLEDAFTKIVTTDYKAEVETLDFINSVQATDTINDWVNKTTLGKIPKLLELGDVDSSTRLALLNAIYFSGQWQSPFDKKKTASQTFIVDARTQRPVQMMQQLHSFRYYEDPDVQVVILPFQTCKDLNIAPCLVVALPKTSDLLTLQKKLKSTVIKTWLEKSASKRVSLRIPKFCLLKRYSMQGPLTSLGLAPPFYPGANFSGIDVNHELFLSKMIHEAYFDLNEDGVEAAAATAAIMNITSANPAAPPIEFVADHPFLFFLLDETTGTLLFLGKYGDPSLAGCK